jgi:ATP-dependent exoDNAse (exonuclease V) beta subunit
MRSQDWPEQPVDLETGDEDAVRLLTIHGAKGLEFPVVFLVGTGGRMADRDSQEHLVLSESLGIGFDYADPERRIRYPTPLKTAMLDEMRSAGLSEELRLLYVAHDAGHGPAVDRRHPCTKTRPRRHAFGGVAGAGGPAS